MGAETLNILPSSETRGSSVNLDALVSKGSDTSQLNEKRLHVDHMRRSQLENTWVSLFASVQGVDVQASMKHLYVGVPTSFVPRPGHLMHFFTALYL